MRGKWAILCVLMMVTLMLVTAAYAADDPFSGSWKLNLTKSKYDPGPAPQSSKLRNEVQGNILKNVTDTVDADGKANHSESTVHVDGKERPVTGNAGYDASASTRVDAYTIVTVMKKAGREIGTMRSVVSKDGRTLTRTLQGTNSKGKAVNTTMVFDKQ